MNLINETVRHKTLGEGIITDIQDRIVNIQFNNGQRKFIFPDSFKDHLSLTDHSSQKYLDNVIAQYSKNEELKQSKEKQELEKRRLHARLPICENSQAAFGLIFNDKQKVLDDWFVTTGSYLSGGSKGQPRIPSEIYPNTACILTQLDKNDPEENRYIWGLFMVRDSFVGSECSDGIIHAHEKFRIVQSKEDRNQFLFWKYFEPSLQEKRSGWGTGEFKYVSNWKTANLILDIYKVRQGPEKQHCKDFFEYFCRLNKFNSELLLNMTQTK